MKKLLAPTLIVLGLTAGNAHAGFTASSAKNGTQNVATLEFTAVSNCVVKLTPKVTNQLINSSETTGIVLASLDVSGAGCDLKQAAVKPNAENWVDGYHTFINQDHAGNKVKSTWEGNGWSEDDTDGTIYRDQQGSGTYDTITFKLEGDIPENGRYTITLTGGTWSA